MKNLTRHLWLAVALLVMVHPAWADLDDFEMTVDCPTEAPAGSTILVDLQLENGQCLPVTVRLMSSVTGNANQSVGGIGVWGPVVADTIVVAAAESSEDPTTCVPDGQCSGDFSSCSTNPDCASGVCIVEWSSCGGGGISCSNDGDCACGEDGSWSATPTIENLTAVQMPPAVPSSLDGTVATFILVAEVNDGFSEAFDVRHCLVNVAP